MHFHFLLEEQSAEELIEQLAPRLLGDDHGYECIRFPGKPALLKRLPDRLRGFRAWLPEDHRLVVLVDRDREDCMDLKAQLEAMARDAGFATPSRTAASEHAQLITRVAIEELEAWYFGDVEALRAAYPRLPSSLGAKSSYRRPDEIAGGTWEALGRELQRAGYHLGGLAKIRAAREIGACMEPARNRSPSFQCFCRGVMSLLGEPAPGRAQVRELESAPEPPAGPARGGRRRARTDGRPRGRRRRRP